MNQSIQAECNICLNEFESEVYIPKILQCGHSLCIVCLKGICKDTQKITCHKCMQVFNVNPDQSITNFGLLEILQSQKQEKKQGQNCNEHNLPKIFFCLTHQGLVCHGCTLGDHASPNCNVKDFRNAYKEMIPNYANQMQVITSQTDKLKKHYQTQEEQSQKIKSDIEQFKEMIAKQTDELINFLQENKQSMIKKADDILQNQVEFSNKEQEQFQLVQQDFQEIQKEQENDQRQDLPQILERIKKLKNIEEKLQAVQLNDQQEKAQKIIVARLFSEQLLQQIKQECDIELQIKQEQQQQKIVQQEEQKIQVIVKEENKQIVKKNKKTNDLEGSILFAAVRKLKLDLSKFQFYYYLEQDQLAKNFQNQQQLDGWIQTLKQEHQLFILEYKPEEKKVISIIGTFLYMDNKKN